MNIANFFEKVSPLEKKKKINLGPGLGGWGGAPPPRRTTRRWLKS